MISSNELSARKPSATARFGSKLRGHPATIRVIVPDPQATVSFEGNPTSSSGTVRVFSTPALTQSVSYRIRTTWSQGGQLVYLERVVTVPPGETTVVDFTQPAPERIPLPY